MAAADSLDTVDMAPVRDLAPVWHARSAAIPVRPPGPVRGSGRSAPRISVVIPTLNEERNVAWVVGRIPALVDEVILADGRSQDRTIEVAQAIRPDLVVVREPRPGKGAALRAAFERATGDIIVMLDADCSMDPQEIPAFVDAIENGADLVKGSRFLPGGGSIDISRLRRLGNRMLLAGTNFLYGASFTELCYGYMALRKDCLPRLGLRATGFEIETEIVVRALGADLRISEVPSFEAERRYGQSNLRTFRDGGRVARTVIGSWLEMTLGARPARLLDDAVATSEALVAVSTEETQVRAEA